MPAVPPVSNKQAREDQDGLLVRPIPLQLAQDQSQFAGYVLSLYHAMQRRLMGLDRSSLQSRLPGTSLGARSWSPPA